MVPRLSRVYNSRWKILILITASNTKYLIDLNDDRVIKVYDDIDIVKTLSAIAYRVTRIIIKDSLLVVWLTINKKTGDYNDK